MKNDTVLQVLKILYDNLKNPQPQVVRIEAIAEKLHLNLKETRQLLLQIDESGEIMCDMEGSYSLITIEGISRLNNQYGFVTA